jgi:hypothetical protein
MGFKNIWKIRKTRINMIQNQLDLWEKKAIMWIILFQKNTYLTP